MWLQSVSIFTAAILAVELIGKLRIYEANTRLLKK
jgi:hypothetical protein